MDIYGYEYQLQLCNLEEKIDVLQKDLRDQTIKNCELENKLSEPQISDQNIEGKADINEELIRKMREYEVLLKESRKQNLAYSDEIRDLRKKETNKDAASKEIEYLKHENLTLKAFIVAQNKMTHYRHAFENLKIENYCTKCSESIQKECIQSSKTEPIQEKNVSNKDIQVPVVNKKEYRNVVDLLNNCPSYTIQLNNNGERLEKMDKKNIKQLSWTVPSINKISLKLMMEKLDVPIDSLDEVARTVIHIGDQVMIRVDWNNEKAIRGTVKYIGNLDERYQYRIFLGVKLSVKISEIPQDYQTNGCFRNKRYFSLNTNCGCFLHFSNVISIYNKETAQFEEFGDYLLHKIDPKANCNTRKNNSIKRLNDK